MSDALLTATTGFARLLLGATFLANLALWVFRYSAAGQIGTLAMVLAMVAAWYSQEKYLQAHTWGEHGLNANAMEAERVANLARWCCAAATACGVLCLVFG